MQVAGRIPAERHLAAVDEPSGAPELGVAAEVVLLQEQQDVVLVYLDDPEVHRGEVHGTERKDEAGIIRKDVPFERYLYGRERVLCREGCLESLAECISTGAAY